MSPPRHDPSASLGTPNSRPAAAPRRRPTPVATAISVGAAAVVVAFGIVHPTPGRRAGALRPRADVVLGGAGPLGLPFVRERVDTLSPRETLADVLVRAGLTRVAAAAAARGAATIPGGLAAGAPIVTRRVGADSTTAEVTARPEVDRVLHLAYLGGAWRAREERLPWHTDTITARSAIASSLFDALHAAVGNRLPNDARSRLVDTLASIFEYRVDVDRDLEQGDSLRMVVERTVDPAGVAHDGRIVAAALTVGGKPVEAIAYRNPHSGRGEATAQYFDQFGKSLRAAFLRAPLQFRRVSSTFGMREHPILGVWKMHTGTDYAASAGTPVRAVGDGTVVFAGQKGGYGNVLEVRHGNGYVSRYGHLRAFAQGVRRGARVAQGRTIGYVGMTGLATAPHLHFEMLLDGAHRDPRAALQSHAGTTISARDRATFDSLRARLLGPDRASAAGAG